MATAGAIGGEEVRERRLARRHLRAELDASRGGGLYAAERLRLLDIYNRPEFREVFGKKPHDLEVRPVEAFLTSTGRRREVIKSWSASKLSQHGLDSGAVYGHNTIGDCKVACVFDDRQERQNPLFLVNSHLLLLLDRYESPDSKVYLWHLCDGCRERPSWGGLCSELPGIRGIDWHLSSGPIEAVRDLWIWFDIEPPRTAVGSALLRGTDLTAMDLVECPYIDYLGRRRVVTELTRGCSVEEARSILLDGRLTETAQSGSDASTWRRVDLAYDEAQDLSRDPRVVAVIATGSVARDRCSEDSDLDLAVISRDSIGERSVELRRLDGITTELDRIPEAEALQIVAGGSADVKRLREASRLGLGLPLHDPEGLAQCLRTRCITLRPDREEVREKLAAVFETLAHLLDDDQAPCDKQWEILRSIYDNLAFIVLLLHPLRYQKAKWVIQDLVCTGNQAILEGLLEAYSIHNDETWAARSIERSRSFFDRLSDVRGLPGYEQTLALGFTREYAELSYACRCLADARSLLADGFVPDAEYTAKFALRLGATLCADSGAEGAQHLPEPLALLVRLGDAVLLESYRGAFGLGLQISGPDEEMFTHCYEAASACRQVYEHAFGRE